MVFHRFYQTCLIIVCGRIGGEIGEKIGRFFEKKIVGVSPHRFPCHTYRFLLKKSADYHRFFYLCLSLEIGGKYRLVGIRLKAGTVTPVCLHQRKWPPGVARSMTAAPPVNARITRSENAPVAPSPHLAPFCMDCRVGLF